MPLFQGPVGNSRRVAWTGSAAARTGWRLASGKCPFRVLVRVHEFLQTIGVLEIGLLDCIAAFRQHGLLEIEPSIRPLC